MAAGLARVAAWGPTLGDLRVVGRFVVGEAARVAAVGHLSVSGHGAPRVGEAAVVARASHRRLGAVVEAARRRGASPVEIRALAAPLTAVQGVAARPPERPYAVA